MPSHSERVRKNYAPAPAPDRGGQRPGSEPPEPRPDAERDAPAPPPPDASRPTPEPPSSP
jgi:hypothetical protein